MSFPDAPRVVYENNPLEEVICQLRFPPVLRIDAEPPALFQDRVRDTYPLYSAKPSVRLPAGLPAELAALVAKDLPFGGGQIAHDFDTADAKWTLALTRDFLALTSRAYDRWETFKRNLNAPLDALQEIYSPAFFIRIGLRYRDVIRRSPLGLQEVPWSELLNPWVAGALASEEVAGDVERSGSEVLIRLPEQGGRLQVHHGLVRDDPSKEPCYVIDCDFFVDTQTETANALARLDYLHQQARLFFRWCIGDRLHGAMRPRPVPGD
jgi:uncharacterized protein (TIGR04255 family)